MKHELKTWPGPFDAILEGKKRYEIRVNDRAYAVGDSLHLREWEPCACLVDDLHPGCGGGRYTGRTINVVVTYLTTGNKWGLPPQLCVMSIEVLRPNAQERLTPEAEIEIEEWAFGDDAKLNMGPDRMGTVPYDVFFKLYEAYIRVRPGGIAGQS